jgi:tetratricopeptide (TPR) repeat protein/tRNA A-37 threonylcarbamoyl transferase component Bud32
VDDAARHGLSRSWQPRAIGPYTLERRLGAGGMGEVFQAYDPRLDRRVAVKLIRSVHAADETARARFVREARAVAQLSHPAIVQIFDFFAAEDGEAIVMELVEGESLARRLARGPLPLGEAVRLGGEMAQGLAAAHDRGLLHRDLKPENVMISSAGHAKILDFGLAKRLEGEGSLTQDHRVVGTFRAMSPEQASGAVLDARSDLFSLGLLLYEMVAGRSPFAGGSALETLTRICTHRQTPLLELDPAIPPRLSQLVDRLLEKERARRPGSAREVSAILGLLAGVPDGAGADLEVTWSPPRWGLPEAADPGATREGSGAEAATVPVRAASGLAGRTASTAGGPRWERVHRWGLALALAVLAVPFFLWRSERSGPRAGGAAGAPLRVVIRHPVIGAGAGETTQLLAAGLEISLLRSLLGFSGIAAEADDAAGSTPQVARALAAEELLTSRLDCAGERCQIALRRVRGSDGKILWASPSFSADADRPHLVEEAVAGYLAEAYAGFARQPGAARLTVRPDDYTRYLRLRRAYDAKRAGEAPSADELIRGLEALRASSPQFVEPYVFEAEVRQQRSKTSQDPADLERAAALLESARQIAPADPRPLAGQFGVALLRGQWEQAEQVLVELERLQPGDPAILVDRARLLDKRGQRQEAMTLMSAGVAKLPSWRNLLRAAHMEFAQGNFGAARGYVERLLADSPENYEGLTLLAQIEFLHGDLDRAAGLYSRLVERYPRPLEQTNLGTVEMYRHRYREAEASFRQVLAEEPRDAFALLNLADTLSLQGRTEEAAALYREVVSAASLAAADWQVLSARAQAKAHLADSSGAVEAVQKMLRTGPDGAQVAYEASLVYVLLGDRNAALFNARRALEQGIEPRMFALPWFDPLRSDATLAPALQGVAPP